ncbi:MAG: AraC family transcriptional regulator [Verrucomicrobiota bacterium]
MAQALSLDVEQLAGLARLLGSQGVQLTKLFDYIENVLVWIKDGGRRYVWVNRAFLLNYAVNEETPFAQLRNVQGKTDHDLCPAFLADQYQADDEQVLRGQAIINRIELVGQGEGLAAWNVTHKIPLRARDGRVTGTAGLTRRLGEEDLAVPISGNFGAALDHLRTRYRETITNGQLARLAGLSVRAFERKFMTSFQSSPQQYLRKLRLRMASRALVFTRQSIVEIALNCGFADQSHLTREFHRYFGRTPRDYRARYLQPAAVSVTKSAGQKQSKARPV